MSTPKRKRAQAPAEVDDVVPPVTLLVNEDAHSDGTPPTKSRKNEDGDRIATNNATPAPVAEEDAPLGKGAQLASDMCDSSRVGKLPPNLRAPPTDRPIRIYSDGIWDLFHFGHAKALEQAKKIFPNVYLMVGVCNDKLTHEKKGKTVMTDIERYESLRHCKWVDEVVPDAPWAIDQAFLDKHKIDYVAHDDIPYKSVESDDVYAFVKQQGRFLPTARTEGVSTSDLITRIVRDYDAYVRRNLERGVSPKELNISFFKEKEIRMKSRLGNIKQSLQNRLQQEETSIKKNWADTKSDLPPYMKATLDYWDDRSTELVKGFTSLFGQEGIPRLFFGRKRNGGDSPGSPMSERRFLGFFRSRSASVDGEGSGEEHNDDSARNSEDGSRDSTPARETPSEETWQKV